ncbi:hypothetical protein EZS27_036953 [termite gut metagenome]|uniref:Uncharacterized protein n=1 Tax=termite gut metagenome TaxID=433724 RepID=A0A5J4PR18_9ZZZZ
MTKHFKLLFVGIVCTFILTPAYKAEAFPFLKKKKRVELTTSKDSARNVTPYDKIFKGKKNVITKKSVSTYIIIGLTGSDVPLRLRASGSFGSSFHLEAK